MRVASAVKYKKIRSRDQMKTVGMIEGGKEKKMMTLSISKGPIKKAIQECLKQVKKTQRIKDCIINWGTSS